MRHAMLEATMGIAVAVAVASCSTSSATSPAGCSYNRSTSEIVPYIPPTCDGGDGATGDAGTCADDFPADEGGTGPVVSPMTSPFCQRHCARFPMLVFVGCSFRSTNQIASGGTVDCIPVGCN